MKPPEPSPNSQSSLSPSATVRWGDLCEAKGQWIKVPKVVLERLGDFRGNNGEQVKPHHLWLLLALQSTKYKDHLPRHYWDDLAFKAGVTKDTVRRWGYELRKMGLLVIKQRRTLGDGQPRKTGYRNERNEFDVAPFVKLCERRQQIFQEEKANKKKARESKFSGQGNEHG